MQQENEKLTIDISFPQEEASTSKTTLANLVSAYPTVYWDVQSERIDPSKHASFLIERMLEHGTLNGIKDILRLFSRAEITEVLKSSRRISRKTGLFWQNYYGLQEPIHCLIEELPNPLSEPWN